MAIVFSASGLGHAFGPRPLFTGVGFTLADGDRVGPIGPNGAGKSTLLRILAGELAPDQGEVAPRGGLRVATLPQSPHFEAELTVRAAIQSGLRAGADHEGEARVDELISR